MQGGEGGSKDWSKSIKGGGGPPWRDPPLGQFWSIPNWQATEITQNEPPQSIEILINENFSWDPMISLSWNGFAFHFPQPISLKMHKVHNCQAMHNEPKRIALSPKMQQVSHYLHILHLDFTKFLVPIHTIDFVSMYTCMAPALSPVGTRLRSLQTWEWNWWNM